jgi:U4/U6 small nuclear ribonucleoprotein PRP3
LDPSKIEAEAKKQTDERINKHLETNSLRKLTKTQKKDKAIRKLKRDSAKECRRAVFKVNKLTDPTHIFKVNMNAKQLALSGFVLKPSNEFAQFPTMVLVEGGTRAVKFYKNLMLKRILWGQNQPSNECKLIWEGEI